MLDNFWESIGSKLAERWIEYIFGPAFLFWVGGLGSYAWKIGWQATLQYVQTLTPFQQGSGLVLALIVLVFSSAVLQALHFPILRLLEGYWPWPFSRLGLGVVALRKRLFQKNNAELHPLALGDRKNLDTIQREKLTTLELWAHWHPVKSRDLLPTRLGNILRAREQSSERKYGLDAIICWPRLWSLLPENIRIDLTGARSALDRLVEFWFWGLLSLLWTLWTPWGAIISLLWMFMAYEMSCQAAMTYGEILEAAFDLHRFSLYDALGWPHPKNTQEEQTLGAQLTEYLWRGTLPKPIKYLNKEK